MQLQIAFNGETYFLDPYNNEVKEKINDDISLYVIQRDKKGYTETSLIKRIIRNSFILCMREMLAEKYANEQKCEDIIKWKELLKKYPSILENEQFVLVGNNN